MTRTKNPPPRRRRPRQPLDARYGIYDRIHIARRLTGWDGRLGDWTKVVGRLPPCAEILRLAGEMGVDPRWLATGEPSAAALEAYELLLLAGFTDDPDDPDDTVLLVELLRQPPAPPNPLSMSNACRYCGCVQEAACDVGCAWADEEQTICTACLEPREEGPCT